MREHNEFRLERLNRHRFEKSAFDKAILVTGATENHAFHLPMGTDTLRGMLWLKRRPPECPGACSAAHPLRSQRSLMPYPFTISLTPETLSQVIFEAVDSCVKQGSLLPRGQRPRRQQLGHRRSHAKGPPGISGRPAGSFPCLVDLRTQPPACRHLCQRQRNRARGRGRDIRCSLHCS